MVRKMFKRFINNNLYAPLREKHHDTKNKRAFINL